MRLVVKSLLPGIFGAAILLAAAAAQADGPAAERRPPRIIFGESEATAFQFREFRPLRRSDASSRQASFGSRETYRSPLARLPAPMEAMAARSSAVRRIGQACVITCRSWWWPAH